MATLEENIAAYLKTDTTLTGYIGPRIYLNELHQTPQDDFLFLQQTGSEDDMALNDGAHESNRIRYTLECVSLKQTSMRTMLKRAQALLHGKYGTIGDQTVKGIFAAEASADYEPRSVSDTSSYKIGALSLEVVT